MCENSSDSVFKLCDICHQPITKQISNSAEARKLCDVCHQLIQKRTSDFLNAFKPCETYFPPIMRKMNTSSSIYCNKCYQPMTKQNKISENHERPNMDTCPREGSSKVKSLSLKTRIKEMADNSPYRKFLSSRQTSQICLRCQLSETNFAINCEFQSIISKCDSGEDVVSESRIVEPLHMNTPIEIAVDEYSKDEVTKAISTNEHGSHDSLVTIAEPNFKATVSLGDICLEAEATNAQEVETLTLNSLLSKIIPVEPVFSKIGNQGDKYQYNNIVNDSGTPTEEPSSVDDYSRGSAVTDHNYSYQDNENDDTTYVTCPHDINVGNKTPYTTESKAIQSCENNNFQVPESKCSIEVSSSPEKPAKQQNTISCATNSSQEYGDIPSDEAQINETEDEKDVEGQNTNLPVNTECPLKCSSPTEFYLRSIEPLTKKRELAENVEAKQKQPKRVLTNEGSETMDAELEIRNEDLRSTKSSRSRSCLLTLKHQETNTNKIFQKPSNIENTRKSTSGTTSNQMSNDMKFDQSLNDQDQLDPETSDPDNQDFTLDTIDDDYYNVQNSLTDEDPSWLSYLKMISQYESDVAMSMPPAEPIPTLSSSFAETGLDYDHNSHLALSPTTSSDYSVNLGNQREYQCSSYRQSLSLMIKVQIQDCVARILQYDSVPPVDFNNASEPITRSIETLASTLTSYYDLVRPGPSNENRNLKSTPRQNKNASDTFSNVKCNKDSDQPEPKM